MVNYYNSDRAGIVSVTLPNEAPALDLNHEYQWSLILMCDGKLRPDSPVVQGDIMRVAADSNLKDWLAQADLLESAAIYNKAGLGSKTVSSSGKLKCTNTQTHSISYSWKNLLKNVGLEKVAKAEFVE